MSRSKTDSDIEQDILNEAKPIIDEGLNLLLEAKPNDAMEFLADYFQTLANSSQKITTKKLVF